MAETKAAAEQAVEERARAAADPVSANSRTNPNFYDDYAYTYLLDDKWETINILKIYCQPLPNKKHKGYWFAVGYIEYLRQPTAENMEVESKVDRVAISVGNSWKE